MKTSFLQWLSPYTWALTLRRLLYDRGFFRSYDFKVPVICVGNITVGGTGKTPMTEYLAGRLLESGKNPMVLSRGYGRITRGFRYVALTDTASDSGDEPLQIKRHFPETVVAVCEDRVRGVRRLIEDYPQDPWIILDDAFQHRQVRAGKNILMADHNRPFTKDTLLPFGRLRDLPSAARRADCIVYTRCPESMTDCKIAGERYTDIPVFYTFMSYGPLLPLHDPAALPGTGAPVLLVTGIANARPLKEYLQKHYLVEYHMEFPDHHRFTDKDFARMRGLLEKNPDWQLITTAKDAVRLTGSGIPGWIIPVQISFFPGESEDAFFHLVTGLP
ncbi:MAG: tetraacyldisaccharide 4'-kinase [Bacteroidales bacterium]|jgi:tetraacyldisaccharide 4'-kinase|nr:tetraacyldisaccharide 4'-kinase [Bacteroidales bacterium]